MQNRLVIAKPKFEMKFISTEINATSKVAFVIRIIYQNKSVYCDTNPYDSTIFLWASLSRNHIVQSSELSSNLFIVKPGWMYDVV